MSSARAARLAWKLPDARDQEAAGTNRSWIPTINNLNFHTRESDNARRLKTRG